MYGKIIHVFSPKELIERLHMFVEWEIENGRFDGNKEDHIVEWAANEINEFQSILSEARQVIRVGPLGLINRIDSKLKGYEDD